MKNISIVIHGGAGTILKKEMTPEKEKAYTAVLSNAVSKGYEILTQGGSSLDAVEQAVIEMENSPLFNAGKGSVFTEKGTHEMDASIMEGKAKTAGAVSQISHIKNPISLARLVMEKSGHVYLGGEGALKFAELMNCEKKDDAYFFDEFRYNQWLQVKGTDSFQLDHSAGKDEKKPYPDNKFGTVGAVAVDTNGNIAAATSTGGMTNKKYGRIGDSSIIGCGTYANNSTCGISCTGSGEFFIRGVVAYDVSCLMEYREIGLQEACDEVIHKRLLDIGGDGGLIGVDGQGNICFSFNTEGMYRAGKSNKGISFVEIYK